MSQLGCDICERHSWFLHLVRGLFVCGRCANKLASRVLA